MELQLKNIGMIKEANLKLDGLTVIAGENNTGKSTVGKLLFSIIKASSRYKEDLEESKEEKIFSLIEKNYFQLRRKMDFSENIELRKLLYPPKFKRDIEQTSLNHAIQERFKTLDAMKQQSLFDIEVDNSNHVSYLSDVEKRLLDLKKISMTQENKTEAQKRAFKKVLISEFKGKISNQNHLDEKSEIKIFEGENQILDIIVHNNKIEEFNIFDELYFSDSTFIESPVLLQLSEAIDNSKTYFEEIDKDEKIMHNRRPNTTLHIKDLIEKMKESAYSEDFFDVEIFFSDFDIEALLDKLSDIMNGNIKYNKKTKDFMYVSTGGKTFDSLNTATGIKAFGIIQMLIKSGFINQRSLLILDEPEVHLHPKWQIKYAEFIIELVKNDINVLVTSHSPYMIEALQRYSEDIAMNRNFYLAKDESILKIDNSNSETLYQIFKKLSEPFETFEEMDSKAFMNV
ncbi:AAA family ATPase [Sulfurovum sp.]|uniref:AAA family ATPase n=1 Tax=Sulfurovum sp. TaxID=1969726 RepID=UPI002867B97F|nr:AAA family ATPase [Sulfurovum sp.]